MLAKVYSCHLTGIEGQLVEVEVDVTTGLPAFDMVGLPDLAVKEAKERVRSAIKNSGYDFPVRRVTVNLAPADLRKEGPSFDLPIALGMLISTEQLAPDRIADYVIAGELSLDGSVRPTRGILPVAITARQLGRLGVIVPSANYREAALVEGLHVIPVERLEQAVLFFDRGEEPELPQIEEPTPPLERSLDLAEVVGQGAVKRAVEVAVAGGHNVLMGGPPGSGKTMLARRIPSIMPPLSFAEALDVTKIYSVAGLLSADSGLVTERPFRSPHHTISHAGLVGGGRIPHPGEVSLAHHGVLFLDEIPEFGRGVLEVLRQPLEDGCVTIARASATMTYPARFMLIASHNPCPCGYNQDNTNRCTCSQSQIDRYRARLSGPLLDRIDIHIEVPRLNYSEFSQSSSGESSGIVKSRVIQARAIQETRLAGTRAFCNAQMGTREIREYCSLAPDVRKLMQQAFDQLGLSMRGHDRILKVARTIADLDGVHNIEMQHLLEAVQYRTREHTA